MSVHADAGWVGRSLRRVEDPALVTGQGRFTADLPAALSVRFVRSAVAAGRIVRITTPPGAMVVTARDLAGAKPIRPMLHKFNYVPISQPILATDVVRFVGEPIAAVVAHSPQEAEDFADRVEVEIEEIPAIVDARAAPAPSSDTRRETWARLSVASSPPDTSPSSRRTPSRITPVEAATADAAPFSASAVCAIVASCRVMRSTVSTRGRRRSVIWTAVASWLANVVIVRMSWRR